jgi:hypothetical protein
MSTAKRVLDPFLVVERGDMSGNITSAASVVRSYDMVTYFIEWSGSAPVGSLSFEYVQKESINPALEHWEQIDLGPAVGSYIPISGNSGSHTIIFSIVPFVKLRAVYTRSSGTGSLDITIVAKEQ